MKMMRSLAWSLLLCSALAWASSYPEIDTTNLGNELATLSDGGAFANPGRTFRQEFCQRAADTLEDLSTIATALAGGELRPSIVPGPYFLYDNINGIDPVYPGIHARMLDYAAARANFTWRDSFGVWTREEKGNRSITDLLVWGADKYDVMVGTYTPSTDRMKKGISFVDGHYDGSLIMIRDVPPPEQEIGWFNWLKPFEPGVWAALFFTVILSSFVYQAIERIGGTRYKDHGDGSFRQWTMTNLYRSFLNFTVNYSYEPTTLGGRVFGVAFAFWAMLISAAYTANLASLLVVRSAGEPAVTDIEDAMQRGLKICVHATSYSEPYLTKTYPGIESLLVPTAKDELYSSLREGQCELMVAYKQSFDTSAKRPEDNPTCTLQWQGRKVQSLMDGFATKLDPAIRCTDLVNEVFNYYIREMSDNGYLDYLWEEHINYYADEDHCGDTNSPINVRRLKGVSSGGAAGGGAAAAMAEGGGGENESSALSLKDMAGTLLFQAISTALALLVAIVSGFDRKTKAKRAERRSTAACSERSINTESTSYHIEGELKDLKQQMGDLMSLMEQIQDKLEQPQSQTGAKHLEEEQQKQKFRFFWEKDGNNAENALSA